MARTAHKSFPGIGLTGKDRDRKVAQFIGGEPPPEPKFPTTLGKDPSKGQYLIPGLGEWGKKKNLREYRERRRRAYEARGTWDPNPTYRNRRSA